MEFSRLRKLQLKTLAKMQERDAQEYAKARDYRETGNLWLAKTYQLTAKVCSKSTRLYLNNFERLENEQ